VKHCGPYFRNFVNRISTIGLPLDYRVGVRLAIASHFANRVTVYESDGLARSSLEKNDPIESRARCRGLWTSLSVFFRMPRSLRLGRHMRVLAIALFLMVSTAWLASAQQAGVGDEFFRVNIKPHLDAYVVCAARHLEQRAKADPGQSFAQVEGSLRPACGNNIDRAREAMSRIGFSQQGATKVIRAWYSDIQGEVRGFHERQVAEVNRQRELARLDAQKEREAKEADIERRKVLQEAASEHHACLRKEMVSIVPFSNEPADTLGTVMMTKCAEHERKRVSLAIAVFGIGRSNAERILKDIGDETRKVIVAEIVSFRAELAKAQTQGQPSKQSKPETGI
jgi:hypothetical protein